MFVALRWKVFLTRVVEPGHRPAEATNSLRKFPMAKTYESNSDARQRGSTPTLTAVVHSRCGLSLIEVLVAIFVVTVGLLGVVTLLPLSQKDASQGAIDDQVSLVGKSAWRDFVIRGMNRPGVWFYGDGQPVYDQSLQTPPTFVLDPWLMARGQAQSFGNLPGIPRATLGDMNGNLCSQDLADELFMFSDDLIFQSPADTVGLPQQLFTGAGDKRSSAGLFSWMAVLSPELAAPQFKPVPGFYHLSVVIFHRRSFSLDPLQNLQNEQVYVATASGGGLGGVDVSISGDLQVKRNQWIALVSRNPLRGVRWYRVARAIEPDSDNPFWQCSLAGPDVDLNTQNGFFVNNLVDGVVVKLADAVVVKGVVAVFEKVIPLDFN